MRGNVRITSNELLGTEIAFVIQAELIIEMVGSSEFNFGKESKDRMRNPLNTLNTGSLEILL